MTYGILFERIAQPDFPAGYYYAHVPALGLTTHGLEIEGAREAVIDLIQLWVAEKKPNGETVSTPSEVLYTTVEVADAVYSA